MNWLLTVAIGACALLALLWQAEAGKHALVDSQRHVAEDRVAVLEAEAQRAHAQCVDAQAADAQIIQRFAEFNQTLADQIGSIASLSDAAVTAAETDARNAWASYYQKQREWEALYENDPALRDWGSQPLPVAVVERLQLDYPHGADADREVATGDAGGNPDRADAEGADPPGSTAADDRTDNERGAARGTRRMHDRPGDQ